jgi:hypothetical protein
MSNNRLIGTIILILGFVLLGFGLNATFSVTEKVVEGVSGQYTQHTMLYIIGGIAMILGGGSLAFFSPCCNK